MKRVTITRAQTTLFLAFLIACRFALDVGEDNRITCRGILVPETCPSRIFYQASCPGCGLTRSVLKLLRGEISDSLNLNPGGLILVSAALISFVLVWLPPSQRIQKLIDSLLLCSVAAFTAAILLNWAFRAF